MGTLTRDEVAHSFQLNQERFLKVPAAQRRENPSAYEPLLFSFGLYHSSSISDDGDHFKQLAANALLSDRARTRLHRDITHLFTQIRSLYVQMNRSSSASDDISDTALIHRIALDGITIAASAMLQVSMKHKVYGNQGHWLPLLVGPIRQMVFVDALLLENQVPIIVIKYALDNLNLMPDIPAKPATLKEILDCYCRAASPFSDFKITTHELQPDSTLMTKPVLSYIYTCLTKEPRSPPSSDVVTDEVSKMSTTASHLARCGVRFRRSNIASFRGISFDKKTMELCIPQMSVGEDTVRCLHNLIAYEAASRYPRERHVVCFAEFMDCLIDTDEDVRILVEAEVLQNDLGSNEKLASMWNNLCNSVSYFPTPSHSKIMKDLQALAKSRWRRWRAALMEKYLEQPWLLLSVVAASILLVLTLLQTIYTIKGAP